MKRIGLIGLIFSLLFLPLAVEAKDYGGVEFPNGAISFADSVISYNPCCSVEAPYNNPNNALGPPDYNESEDTEEAITAAYVCLGDANNICECGSLILKFTDNAIVDIPGNDLYVFEIGPVVEATEVFISTDGQEWIDLGRIEGSTRGVDIHDKVSPGQKFHFVKLCDFPDGETSNWKWPGPDIDAVGAIGTIPVSGRTLDWITIKRNNIHPTEKDKYGHWWIEILDGPNGKPIESYGWWPKFGVGLRETLPGDLNGRTSFHGTDIRDPYQGDVSDESFHPRLRNLQTDQQVLDRIHDFVRRYKGEWQWKLGWGQNSIFQTELMDYIGLVK
jgi:hypothetical protein